MRKIPVFEPATPPDSTLYRVSSRKFLARSPELTVWDFVLAPGEGMPLHHHTACYDTFFCVSGRMRVQCRDVADGEPYEDILLASGDSAKVEAGIAHRPYNPYGDYCRFLLIQGGAPKDFLLA